MRPTVRFLFAASAALLLGSQSSEAQADGGTCQQRVCPLRPADAQQADQAPGQQGEQVQEQRQAQADQPQAPQAQETQQIEGNVSHVATLVQDFRVVDPDTGRIVTLDVEPDTEIKRGEARVELGQIREGAEVRVSYELRKDALVATRIEVSPESSEPAEILEEGGPGRSPLLAVEGRVTDKSNMNLDFKVVDPERRLAVTLDAADQTAFVLDGGRVDFDALVPGQQVRAIYRANKRGDLVAQRVEITAAPSTPSGPPTTNPQQ